MTLFDSPLNKSGHLEVYLSTNKKILIKINPETRIPRTYKRFAGLMVQLLHNYRIRDSEGTACLFNTVKHPITDHLPMNCPKIYLTETSKICMRLSKFVSCDFLKKLTPKPNAANLNEKKRKAPEEENEEENFENSKKKLKKNDESAKNADSVKKDKEDEEEEEKEPEKDEIKFSFDKDKQTACFIVGGFAHGELKVDYSDHELSISKVPLSAAVCCARICGAFEDYWEVL